MCPGPRKTLEACKRLAMERTPHRMFRVGPAAGGDVANHGRHKAHNSGKQDW